MVAVQSGPNKVSAWYVSVPSVQKALWPRVPNFDQGNQGRLNCLDAGP